MSVEATELGTILIVDDNPTNLALMFDFLNNSGFKVLVAREGVGAIQNAEYASPDLILLDVLMPGMDGFETCAQLKARELTKDIPVIFMTALSEMVDKVKGLSLGAVDYITKPLQPEEVLARVKIHLSLRHLTKKLQEQNWRLEQEIQERKSSEQKISEQAALLNIATDAILVQDLGNQILFWNQGAERLYGWKAEEAISKNAAKLLERENSPHTKLHCQSLLECGSWQGDLCQVTKEGKDIIVASRRTLVRDQDGQPKSILTVNTDITEKKQLEAQFLRAQRMESVGTLASGIAHDLNNALAPIMMSIPLLQQKLQDNQSQQILKTMETNTKRSADLVKQVLSFVRGLEGNAYGTGKALRTTLQVEHLILDIEQIAKQTFSKVIDIRTDLQTLDLWTISGDANQLHQVLMNLCVNARDAMPDGGVLQISAKNLWIDDNYARMHLDAKAGPYVVITVSDTGTGISSEIIDRIFEPFFTTKELGKGTGLGLSTVMAIVKSHGGFVTVYSEVGQGTRFKVYLPTTQATTTADMQQESQESLRGQGELILVVDDEDSIREVTKTSLETNAYKVLTASDGIEAVTLYAQYKEEISIVLVDMMMPLMDGSTTIRTLQKINPQVKVIAVSGLMSNSQVAQSMATTVQRCLPKPYTSDELLKELQVVLRTK